MFDTRITIYKNHISLSFMLAVSYLLSATITFVYGRSITAIYALLILAVAFFGIYFLFARFYTIDAFSRRIVVVLTAMSFLNGFLRLEIKSPILLSSSLILPLVISALEIDEERYEKKHLNYIPACAIALILVAGQSAGRLFSGFNSNTIAFLGYMGVSVGVLWYTNSKNKTIPLAYLVIGSLVLLGTDCRNVAIVILFCFVMILIPQKLYKNPYFFFVICLIPIIYTIFAKDILDFVFSNERISALLYDYTEQVSEKAWDMAQRAAFLKGVERVIAARSIFSNLFGQGILKGHSHNLFYQSVFVYGYLGTALVYAFYIRIFWMGYRLIKENEDKIALGCVIMMLGHFWLQGADVYMVGVETVAIMPQIVMGIIMQRYRVYKKAKK